MVVSAALYSDCCKVGGQSAAAGKAPTYISWHAPCAVDAVAVQLLHPLLVSQALNNVNLLLHLLLWPLLGT
jgi:hypothetical protein